MDDPRPIAVEFEAKLTALVYREEDGGYSAEVPALPGCFTEGDTLDEIRANLREAAEGWLASQHEHAVRDAAEADTPR
jgi:predicted RNase H-like HicB family nuclease